VFSRAGRTQARSAHSMTQLISLIVSRLAAARDEDRGATMVEYGLLVALISIAAIVIITAVGLDVADAFQDVREALPGTN
jgi:pilus assembly protein Flp/PilA